MGEVPGEIFQLEKAPVLKLTPIRLIFTLTHQTPVDLQSNLIDWFLYDGNLGI